MRAHGAVQVQVGGAVTLLSVAGFYLFQVGLAYLGEAFAHSRDSPLMETEVHLKFVPSLLQPTGVSSLDFVTNS